MGKALVQQFGSIHVLPSVEPETARDRIKEATRHQHKALHEHPVSISMLGGDSTAFLAFLKSKRDVLDALGPYRDLINEIGFYAYDEMLSRLLSDTAEYEGLNKSIHPDPSAAYVSGVAYVMVGSLFGRKAVARAADFLAQSRYMSMPFPRETWDSILFSLDANYRSPVAWTECLSGAADAFEIVNNRLSAHGTTARPRRQASA